MEQAPRLVSFLFNPVLAIAKLVLVLEALLTDIETWDGLLVGHLTRHVSTALLFRDCLLAMLDDLHLSWVVTLLIDLLCHLLRLISI